jgi:predicted GIY-YIG superfamily endonuclease
MSETAEQVVGCECGDPRNRRYVYQDWEKTPARLYWACQGCADVGVLFVHQEKPMSGYGTPRPIDMATIDQLVRWEAIDEARRRRPNSFAATGSVVVTESELIAAIRGTQARLREKLDREAAAHENHHREATEVAIRERERYQMLKARLRAWHDRKSVRCNRQEPALEVLICGGEAVAVYALVDPQEPGRIRYVGKTNNPMGRYQDHCKNNGWAAELLRNGRTPMMLLIEWAPTNANALDREAFWINHYRGLGMADINLHVPRMVAA